MYCSSLSLIGLYLLRRVMSWSVKAPDIEAAFFLNKSFIPIAFFLSKVVTNCLFVQMLGYWVGMNLVIRPNMDAIMHMNIY